MSAVTPALEVNGLTKRFGANTVVDSLTFTVPRGAITGFVGGNGAGKSTTMRMILGLTTPTAGSILIDGAPLSKHREPRRVVGAQIERPGAHPGLTGRRHLSLIATAAGIKWLRTLLRSRADRGDAIFVSTHQLAELGTIVDNLVIIEEGRLVTAGPVDELLGNASVKNIEDLLLSGEPS